MITQLTGTLVAIDDGAAHVQVAELTYEVLVPAADSMALAARIGQPVRFHTLHYLEGQGRAPASGRASLASRRPPTAPSSSSSPPSRDRQPQGAARAAAPVRPGRRGDSRARPRAPQSSRIGKRNAEAICVELKGKVDPFVRSLGAPAGRQPAKAGARAAPTVESKLMAPRTRGRVLAQLGHSKPVARDMVERVLAREDLPPTDAERDRRARAAVSA